MGKNCQVRSARRRCGGPLGRSRVALSTQAGAGGGWAPSAPLMGLVAQLTMVLALGVGNVSTDGYAAHYADGLFERVAIRRGLPAASCYISSDWHAIGEWVLVDGLRTGQRLRCLVADVSQPRDRARHLRARLFEVDFHSASVLCGSTKLPNRQCPIRVSPSSLARRGPSSSRSFATLLMRGSGEPPHCAIGRRC